MYFVPDISKDNSSALIKYFPIFSFHVAPLRPRSASILEYDLPSEGGCSEEDYKISGSGSGTCTGVPGSWRMVQKW